MGTDIHIELIERLSNIFEPSNLAKLRVFGEFLVSVGDDGFERWSLTNLHRPSSDYIADRGYAEAFRKFCEERKGNDNEKEK